MSKSKKSIVTQLLLTQTMRQHLVLTTLKDIWRIRQALVVDVLRTQASTTPTMRNKRMSLQPRTRLRKTALAILPPRRIVIQLAVKNLQLFSNSKKWKRPWKKSGRRERKFKGSRRSWSKRRRRYCKTASRKWKPSRGEKWTERGNWGSRKSKKTILRSSLSKRGLKCTNQLRKAASLLRKRLRPNPFQSQSRKLSQRSLNRWTKTLRSRALNCWHREKRKSLLIILLKNHLNLPRTRRRRHQIKRSKRRDHRTKRGMTRR